MRISFVNNHSPRSVSRPFNRSFVNRDEDKTHLRETIKTEWLINEDFYKFSDETQWIDDCEVDEWKLWQSKSVESCMGFWSAIVAID